MCCKWQSVEQVLFGDDEQTKRLAKRDDLHGRFIGRRNGGGKTTTAAKLANRDRGANPMLAACDTFRAAPNT